MQSPFNLLNSPVIVIIFHIRSIHYSNNRPRSTSLLIAMNFFFIFNQAMIATVAATTSSIAIANTHGKTLRGARIETDPEVNVVTANGDAAADVFSNLRGDDGDRRLSSHSIDLGACEDFALMVGTAATCAGTEDCLIDGGYLGVSSITGNFVGTVRTTAESAPCAADGLAALTEGVALGASVLATPIAAEMGGITFTPGIYKAGTSLNIAVANLVYLDGDADDEFIFVAGTTLTAGAGVEIVLLNGAKADNVFWVLGTALAMGANSILVGNVLAGSTITMGTNAQITGRAIAQGAVTCGTACVVNSP